MYSMHILDAPFGLHWSSSEDECIQTAIELQNNDKTKDTVYDIRHNDIRIGIVHRGAYYRRDFELGYI